jgi:hypothetical protein
MEGAPVAGVDTQESTGQLEERIASYFPPVAKRALPESTPPQMIAWEPDQTMVCRLRATGAFVVVVEFHVSLTGS